VSYPLLPSVYFGIARRALDLAILSSQTRTSLRPDVSRHSQKPAVQRQIAQGELERLLRDVRTGSLHPPNTDAVLEAIGATALGQT
jgi:alkylation response protein AidB-like acyl-CoA dehydrogenase